MLTRKLTFGENVQAMLFKQHRLFVFLTFALFFSPMSIFATNYYISTSGSNPGTPNDSNDPYATIQYIFSNYNLDAGDSIIIAAGTYSENSIDIGSNDEGFVIYGSDSSTVIFDNEGGSQYFMKTTDDNNDFWTIKGVTIQNYRGSGSYGAIEVSHKSTAISFTGCIFYNNYGTNYAAAIYFYHEWITFTISDCQFISNTTGGSGGAIQIGSTSQYLTGTFNNCTFRDNGAENYGGFLENEGDNVDLDFNDCVFDGNWSNGYGGAVAGYFSGDYFDPIFNRCLFFDNGKNCGTTVTAGGYAYYSLSSGGDAEFHSCLLYENAGTQGGVILADRTSLPASGDNDVRLYNCTVADNVSTGGFPAGLVADEWDNSNEGNIYAYNCILYGNTDADAEEWVGYGYVSLSYCVYGTVDVSSNSNGYNSDPNFVNSAADNYDIQAGSDAENNGNNGDAPSFDFTNANRANPPDIGAYELGNGSTCSEPSNQVTDLGESAHDSVSVTLTWSSPADGDNVLIVMSTSSDIADPSNGSTYTASTVFTSGTDVGCSGYAVYSGNGTNATITGLSYATTYYVEIFNYNAAGKCYNVTSPDTYNFTTDSCYIHVDDGSNDNDVWTAGAIGSDVTGTGTAAAPYASIKKVHENHLLNSATVIRVDYGTYNTDNERNINPDNNDVGFMILGASQTGTIIDPTSTFRAFYLQDNGSVTFKNLTIQGGNPSTGEGAGVYFEEANEVTLSFIGVNLTNNSTAANTDGGALYVKEDGANHVNVVMTRCSIYSNLADNGAGIYLKGGSSGLYSITRCVFYDNDASTGNGSAIYKSSGKLHAENCLFYENANNTSFDRGTIFSSWGTDTLNSCTVADNTGNDAGFYKANSTAYIWNCLFHNNQGTDDIHNDATVHVYNTYYPGKDGLFDTNTDNVVSSTDYFANKANDDYDIKSGSAPQNTGNHHNAPSVDITGANRDGNPDVGCYEQGNGPTAQLCSQDLVWTGATSTSWNVSTNWTPNTVPCGNNITINDVGNDPVLDTKGDCGNVLFNTGANLTWSSTDSLKIAGNLDMDGTSSISHTSTGVLYMSGATKTINIESDATVSTVPVTIGGTVTNETNVTFDDITVKTGATLTTTNSTKITLSGTLDNDGTITFGGTSDEIEVAENVDNDGTITLGTSSILDVTGNVDNASGKTLTLSSGTMNVGGNLTNAGTFDDGTSTVIFDGGGNSLITDADGIEFYKLTLNKDATNDVVSCNSADDDVTVANNLLISEGTYTNGAADFAVTGTTVIDDGKLIAGSSNGPVVLTGNITMNNDAIIDHQATDGAGNIEVYGSIDMNGTSGIQSSTSTSFYIELRGGTKFVTCETAANSSSSNWYFYEDYSINDDLTVGSLNTASNGSAAITVATGKTLAGTTLYNRNNATITLSGTANMTLSGNAWLAHHTGATFTLNSGTLDLNGSQVRFSGGSDTEGTFNANSGTVRVSGTIMSTGGNEGVHNWGTSTLQLDGDASASIYAYSGESYYNLEVTKDATDDIITLSSNITVSNDFTNTEGTFHINTQTVDIAGVLNIDGGELYLQDGTLRADDATIDMDGGVFDVDGGTVDFYNNASNDYDFNISGGKVEAGGGTWTIEDDIYITGGEFELNGATITTYGADIDAKGCLYLTGGEYEQISGTMNVGDGNVAFMDNEGGTVDIDGGTLNVREHYEQASGTWEISGGTLNLGIDDAGAFEINGGSYSLEGGDIYFKNCNSAISDEIEIESAATMVAVTGGTFHFECADAITGEAGITVESGEKIFNLTINQADAAEVRLKDNLYMEGSLTITDGLFSASSLDYDVTIEGDWINNDANDDGTTGGGFDPHDGTVTFAGSSAQEIKGSFTSTFHDVVINNGSGVSISKATTIVDDLTLTNGNITTSWTNKLIMDNGANNDNDDIIGGTSTSFINGPVEIVGYQGTTALFVPVGDGTHFAPIQVTQETGGVSNTWEFRYADTSARTSRTSICGAGNIEKVSDEDIFYIHRTAGTENAKVRLYWNSNSDVTETAIEDLVIAHYDWGNTCWEGTNADTSQFTKNKADDGALGTLGYIETDFYVSDFSPFAFSGRFGTTLLPVELLSFDAEYDSENEEVLLDWVTASELDNDYFDIQRKKDGGKWSSIDRVYGAGTSTMNLYYSTVDANPYGGMSHYRLKQVDFDGNSSYSDVKSITTGFMSSVVDFTVTYDAGLIYVNLEDNKRSYYKLEVINIAGQVVYRNMEYSNEGLNTYQIEQLLGQGMYYVVMSNDSEIYSSNIVVR